MQCFKTKLCHFFAQGRCTRGGNCTFAHAVNELKSIPDLRKTKLCHAWATRGCDDESCRYAHGEEELRKYENAELASNSGDIQLDVKASPNKKGSDKVHEKKQKQPANAAFSKITYCEPPGLNKSTVQSCSSSCASTDIGSALSDISGDKMNRYNAWLEDGRIKEPLITGRQRTEQPLYGYDAKCFYNPEIWAMNTQNGMSQLAPEHFEQETSGIADMTPRNMIHQNMDFYEADWNCQGAQELPYSENMISEWYRSKIARDEFTKEDLWWLIRHMSESYGDMPRACMMLINMLDASKNYEAKNEVLHAMRNVQHGTQSSRYCHPYDYDTKPTNIDSKLADYLESRTSYNLDSKMTVRLDSRYMGCMDKRISGYHDNRVPKYESKPMQYDAMVNNMDARRHGYNMASNGFR